MIMTKVPPVINPTNDSIETAADRMGRRIRRIRMEKGFSQSELGEKVGLSADRIQKYENGVSMPKEDLLNKIASALGVNPLALKDPDTTTCVGAMYAMFEMEDCFGLQIKDASADQQPSMCLSADFKSSLYPYMEEWHMIYEATKAKLQAASSQSEENEIMKEYHDWKWNFPQGIVDRTTKDVQKIRLKKKIDELQKAYDMLNDE